MGTLACPATKHRGPLWGTALVHSWSFPPAPSPEACAQKQGMRYSVVSGHGRVLAGVQGRLCGGGWGAGRTIWPYRTDLGWVTGIKIVIKSMSFWDGICGFKSWLFPLPVLVALGTSFNHPKAYTCKMEIKPASASFCQGEIHSLGNAYSTAHDT